MGGIIVRKSILGLIGACIVIGFVSQAQNSQTDEASLLYEFRAAQTAEEFGLAPDGSANSDLDFGSVDTAELTVKNTQINSDMVNTKQPPPPSTARQCSSTGGLRCTGHRCNPVTGRQCPDTEYRCPASQKKLNHP
jgi:hypothetical protein